jgi:hypothetical protein
MCPLRCRSAQLLFVAAILPLAALAGCAADASRMPTGAVPGSAASRPLLPNPLRAILAADGALSDHEAEVVIAQAIAQHEMHRP